MGSLLEQIPRDVLEHIAFLVTTFDIFGVPNDLLHLLLTCSTIYHSLSISSAPHLYSRIYQAKYDTGALYHRISATTLTDSAVATELVLRSRLLRRVRKRDLTQQGLGQDFGTAMRMTLESDGLNEAHLHSVHFSQYLSTFVRLALERDRESRGSTITMALWLLALHLSKADIAELSEGQRTLFHRLLRPLIFSSLNGDAVTAPTAIETPTQIRDTFSLPSDSKSGNTKEVYSCPDAASAAILLTLALNETNEIQVPPHLPVNRAAARSSGRSGPTMEDYRVIASYRTALFGDDRPAINGMLGTGYDRSRSRRHDPDFHQKVVGGPATLGTHAYCYIGQFLEGVWEGYYMVSSIGSSDCSGSLRKCSDDLPDFLCRTPMQCSLTLYFSFDDPAAGTNTPWCNTATSIEGEVDNWSVRACDFNVSDTRLELSGVTTPYERLASSEDLDSKRLSQAKDCLIVGQTLEEHEEAWGAFTFAGRVSKDGRITLRREPKHSSEAGLGIWIFQGHLRFGTALVGTWRSRVARDLPGVCGLFSMGRK
ncbi:hypothetical protein WG66_010111 [Moniliophthora roreri]|nr:hypothetical protein WG66_010111 [Moniliophthora roreri]